MHVSRIKTRRKKKTFDKNEVGGLALPGYLTPEYK